MKLPGPIRRILLATAGTLLVSFPILSLKVDENEIDAGARKLVIASFCAKRSFVTITWHAFQLAGAVLVIGLFFYAAGTALRNARRQEWWNRAVRSGAPIARGATDWRVRTGLLILLLAFLGAFPWLLPGKVNLGVETLIYTTLALGLNVVVGYAGLLVLGYAAFFALGAYTYALLTIHTGMSMWLAFPFAGGVAMLAGLLLGLPSLRLRGDYLAIVTLGFGLLVYYVLKTEQAVTGGEMGLPLGLTGKKAWMDLQEPTALPALGIGKLSEPGDFWWPALALTILAVVVIRFVERSRIGRALMAMREDETAARCMGIHTTRLKLAAFSFSAMWAGFAGVLWCAKFGYVNPKFFDFDQSVIMLSMVVLGGMGSIPGVIVGGVILYAGPDLLRNYLPELQEYRLLGVGAILILLMIYRPQGLFGSSRRKAELAAGEEDG